MNIFKRGLIATLMMALMTFSAARAQQTSNDEALLNPKQQHLIIIAAYTAVGDLAKLKEELHSGLNAGLTVNQSKEALVHLYAYAGFPRSIRGLQTLMTVLDERTARGIQDKMGAEASPIEDQRNKYDRGREVLEKLTGMPQSKPQTGYGAFAPEIEVFLKEHLFADIFERDVLSYPERELVTVSVLSSIGGVEPMLRSHLNICLNVGLMPGQLHQFVEIIRSTIGNDQAEAARKVLAEVLNK